MDKETLIFSPKPTPSAMFPISGNDNSILLVPQTRNFIVILAHMQFHQEIPEALPSKYIQNQAPLSTTILVLSHNHLSPELMQ